MDLEPLLLERLKQYGVGPRKLDDELFVGDKPLPRLGIFDIDDENLCHGVLRSSCHIPGCTFTAESLLEFESHYAAHRYSCSQCRKVLPSAHLLDLHIQENHDSFFAVMATRKPSYSCYVAECKDKFVNPESRLGHCVEVHKLPKDFRFDQKPKAPKKKGKEKSKENFMDVDEGAAAGNKKIVFNNSRNRGFSKYTGMKFTKQEKECVPPDVDMDDIAKELKESLPE